MPPSFAVWSGHWRFLCHGVLGSIRARSWDTTHEASIWEQRLDANRGRCQRVSIVRRSGGTAPRFTRQGRFAAQRHGRL